MTISTCSSGLLIVGYHQPRSGCGHTLYPTRTLKVYDISDIRLVDALPISTSHQHLTERLTIPKAIVATIQGTLPPVHASRTCSFSISDIFAWYNSAAIPFFLREAWTNLHCRSAAPYYPNLTIIRTVSTKEQYTIPTPAGLFRCTVSAWTFMIV